MKHFIRIFSIMLCLMLLAACGSEAPGSTGTPETTQATAATTAAQAEGIRNIIIIIGDGTGDAQLQAGELSAGKTFCFRDWQHAFSNTDSLHADGTVGKLTDSAAGGTALATGQLTTNGKVAQPYNSTDPLKTILDYAKEQGKATGVVSTDTMHGATPAAFSGHAVSREDSLTILNTQLDSDIDLLCATYNAEAGGMKSAAESAGYTFTDFSSKLGKTMDAEKAYWLLDMDGSNPPDKLEKIVPKAIEFLSKDPDGFVMMIEQAHVDKYCHSNEIEGAQLCANSLNNTVEAILQWCEGREDTAIIITADHETGGLSVSSEEIYEHRYKSPQGNTVYYQFTSTGHTQAPVPVYFYGFEADLEPYYLDEEKTTIKNINIFDIMLDLLNNPVRK